MSYEDILNFWRISQNKEIYCLMFVFFCVVNLSFLEDKYTIKIVIWIYGVFKMIYNVLTIKKCELNI